KLCTEVLYAPNRVNRVACRSGHEVRRVEVPVAQQQLPPPVRKILLGHELERLRKASGLTQEDAAHVLRCTQQKIGYIEGGGGIKYLELTGLLDAYGAGETDSAYALDLHQDSNRRAKRGGFRSRFRQHMRLFV